MLDLILIITPIALLDSTSIIPVCLVPLANLLASRRPILAAGALVAGLGADLRVPSVLPVNAQPVSGSMMV